jgi:hypothetical protein
MLMPLEAAIAEGVETPEEEVRFTHVSFSCLRRAESYRCFKECIHELIIALQVVYQIMVCSSIADDFLGSVHQEIN